jgi:hypothetical protein
MKHIFLAIALLFSAHLARSAPLGAVVQSSTYDPTNGVTTVHIVNVSHKDITAFIISTKETRADGTVEEGEQMYEFLTTMISVAESGGTIPSVHGSGAFAPGESREETFQHSSKGTQVQLEVTVVAYADATAQVTDQRAFQNLVTQRQSRVAAMRKTNEVIKQTLADPPSRTTVRRLPLNWRGWPSLTRNLLTRSLRQRRRHWNSQTLKSRRTRLP